MAPLGVLKMGLGRRVTLAFALAIGQRFHTRRRSIAILLKTPPKLCTSRQSALQTPSVGGEDVATFGPDHIDKIRCDASHQS